MNRTYFQLSNVAGTEELQKKEKAKRVKIENPK